MGTQLISAGFILLNVMVAISSVNSALVCNFGAGNMADLILRNQTYISYTNTFLYDFAFNASNTILSVSNFNLVNYLANNLGWDLTRQSQYVTRGILLQLDWINITKPYISSVSLPSYIQANYINPVHTKMQYFADTYVMSRGIYRPTVMQFSYSGLDTASMIDIVVSQSCLAGSRVIIRVPTDLTYASSYVNRNSTDFAAFTTMIETAFDEFFREAQSIFTNDFIRVNLWVIGAMSSGRYTYVGADLELYFQNVHTALEIQNYVIGNITRMQPLAIVNTQVIPVSLFTTSITGVAYYIGPTTISAGSAASTSTPSTVTKALPTTITPSTSAETSTPSTPVLLTSILPTTQSLPTSTISTPSITTVMTYPDTATPANTITTYLGTTTVLTPANTPSTSNNGLIAVQTTSIPTNSTLAAQNVYSTSVQNSTSTLNSSFTNSSLLSQNTTSTNNNTVFNVNANVTLSPNTSVTPWNSQNQTTVPSSNTNSNASASGNATSINNNVTTLNPSQISSSNNSNSTLNPSQVSSSKNSNSTLNPYPNGSMSNTSTTYDPDPYFLPTAPVIPKKYNDPVMLPRIIRASAVAPIEVQAAILKITVPIAAGIIGLITALLVCLQAEWLPKLGK